MSELLKPVFYYSVLSDNVGDRAIRKCIVEAIRERIDVPITFLNTQFPELTEERIVKQLNIEASALMIAGGGLYCNIQKSSGWYFPCSPDLFDKIKIPIILFGIGYNSNLKGNLFQEGFNDFTANSITKINKYAKISTVRDKRTYDILKQFGIKNHELMLDPACFLKYKPQTGGRRVAIQIAQHNPILGRYDGVPIYRNQNINNFAVICRILEQYGFEPIYIAFDPLEQSAIADLKELYPKLIYLNTHNIDRILEEYSRCAFSIGMKMHSNILSFATNTPFISIYYDKKSPEFLKMINWKYGISCYDNYLTTIATYIDDMYHNHPKYRQLLKQIKENEKPLFVDAINRVCQIIDPSSSKLKDVPDIPLTVLMPVYNRQDYVEEAINSILKQTYRNFTFLIYDDGSIDKTVEIIERIADKDARIKLIKGEVNHGGLYSRQKLLDMCETEYATWQDSDDISHPDRFALELKEIKQHDLVYTQWDYLEYSSNQWIHRKVYSHALGLVSSMFKIDRNIKMNVNRMWGSLVWFNAMQDRYPNWKVISPILYSIRRHPGRITYLKQKIDKLISLKLITEDEALAMNYQQLEDLWKKHE